MRSIIFLVIFAALTFSVAGCNTIQGLGTDITEIARHSQDLLEGAYDSTLGPTASTN